MKLKLLKKIKKKRKRTERIKGKTSQKTIKLIKMTKRIKIMIRRIPALKSIQMRFQLKLIRDYLLLIFYKFQ
jgi:hypothetical protein